MTMSSINNVLGKFMKQMNKGFDLKSGPYMYINN